MLKLELSFDDWANIIAGLCVADEALTREVGPVQDVLDLRATLARIETAVMESKLA